MERARARDADAFELLVEEHLAGIHRIAVAIVGPADAMDVTQDTFVAAWQQLPRLRNADAFAGWLRRIGVNAARQWLRRTRRRREWGSLEENQGPMVDASEGQRDFRTAVEARALIEPAIERLTPDQRAILALHYTLGYSIADAADALDIRVGTAKSRLNAALRSLRSAIDPAAADGEAEAEIEATS
ncbi:MAG TPA: RNA polymerase sigma factor [Candidatus Limnocylindria bacterium]|nr:RNA polymerase sigma factor [Candidatus Limnocylindria bacterium]